MGDQATAGSTKRDMDSAPNGREKVKRARGLSPDSTASSPDTIVSVPDSPHTQLHSSSLLNAGSSNGVSGSSETEEQRVHGRGVLEKKLLKYQQLLAARKRAELVS